MVFSNFTAITTLRAHLFNHHLSSSRRLSFGVGSFPHLMIRSMLRPRLILALETALPHKTDAYTLRSHRGGLCTNILLDSWHVPHRVSFGVPGKHLFSYLRRLSIKSTFIARCDRHDTGQLFFFRMHGGGLLLGHRVDEGLRICLFVLLNAFHVASQIFDHTHVV